MNRKPHLLTKLRKPLSLMLACALAFAPASAAVAGENDPEPGLSATPMPGAWQNTDVTVTLGIIGLENPLNHQYALTQSADMPVVYDNYTDPVTISGEGEFYLHYRVTQGQVNQYNASFGPYKIDKTAPNFSQGLVPEATAISHSEISLGACAIDALSGVASYRWQYALTPGGPYTEGPGGVTGACTHTGLAADTTYYYILLVTDNAGNVLTTEEISATTPRAPYEADADNNTITLSTFNPAPGEPFDFTAAGDGQNGAGGIEGDTRFIPQDWSVNPSGTFPEGGPYSARAVLSAPGAYTLRVVFRLEKWSDGAWRDTGTTDVKSASLRVWAEEAILDVPQTGDDGARWLGWVLICAPLAIAAAALLRRRRAV